MTDRFGTFCAPRSVAPAIGGALALCAVALLAGCQDTNRSTPQSVAGTSGTRRSMNDQNLTYAIGVLRKLDESQTPQALSTVVARLNQWGAAKQAAADWQPDPLLQSVPDELRKIAGLRGLAELVFPDSDGLDLQQTVWLAEIAAHVAGNEGDPLARAQALFDWTVRNIQLEAAGSIDIPHVPAETLLFGRGTAEDRAWIFALLARQQGLDVVVLALPDRAADGGKVAGPAPDAANPAPAAAGRFWLPALVLDGELHLFDTTLGLAIPGPDGTGVATLRQAQGDESLLRRLDLDTAHPYPVRAADLERVTVLVEASPIYLSQRMQLIESQLSGKDQLVLTARPAALGEKLQAHPRVVDVRLWALPYERIRRKSAPDRETLQRAMREMMPFQQPSPVLWRARVLHLLGRYSGETSANALYQEARPADTDIQSLADKRYDQNRAQVDALAGVLKTAKQNASYWLGLVAYERGAYDAAVDYLQTRTLEAVPDGAWTAGARYNLARTLEQMDQVEAAVKLYEADRSPQRHGNVLRARWLKAAAAASPPAPDTGAKAAGDAAPAPDQPAADAPTADAPASDAPGKDGLPTDSPAAPPGEG